MKKVSLCALAVAGALTVGVQNANAGLLLDGYIAGGIVSQKSDINDGSVIEFPVEDKAAGYVFALGNKFSVPFITIRAELEYSSIDMQSELTNASLNYDSLMLNGYFDIPFPTPFLSPYVGFGTGKFFDVDANTGLNSYSGDSSGMQYMLGIRLSFPLLPVGASIEYRRTEIDAIASGVDITSEAVVTRVSYQF